MSLWRVGSSVFSNQNLTTSGIEVVCAEVTMVTVESYNSHRFVLTDIRLSDLGPCHLRHVVDVTSLPLSKIRLTNAVWCDKSRLLEPKIQPIHFIGTLTFGSLQLDVWEQCESNEVGQVPEYVQAFSRIENFTSLGRKSTPCREKHTGPKEH